jgi:integrase/recombinase XerD
MLLKLYPKVHRRYTSLPILGPILDGFGTWLLKQGYATDCVREHFCTARRLTRILEQRGIHSLTKLTRARLRACAPANRLDDHRLTATVHLLERYFVSETLLFPPRPRTRIEDRVASFAIYLEQIRGLASSSIEAHCKTTSALLAHIGYERCPRRLGTLTARDIEAFICRGGKGLGRRSLQHMVTHLRAFLRFAGSRGEAPIGLDRQIDTPRVYREEQLPRALPWEIVQALLRTIDRTTPGGLRDYAILLLIATYGLRAGEIVGLTLDDVEWRARRLRVRQRKTGGVLWLPLTERGRNRAAGLPARGTSSARRAALPTRLPDRSETVSGGLSPMPHARGRAPVNGDRRSLPSMVAAKRIEDPFSGGSLSSPFVRRSPLAVNLQFVEPLATLASERFARQCGALVTARARGGAR